MSDETTAQTGASVAPVENTAPTQEQTQANAPESTTEQVEAQDDRPRDDKGRFVPQERVNEITRARRTAERNWEAAERRAQELEQKLSALQGQQPQSRSLEIPEFDYADPTGWAARVVETAESRAVSKSEERLREQQAQRERQAAFEKYGEREAKFKAEHADFDDVVSDLQGIRLQPEVVEAIALSDYGPAVLYHLATHLDEADRIARLSPHLAAVQLGRIEAQVSAPKPKPVTKAPQPGPTLTGGSSPAGKIRQGMSYEEYVAARMGG